VECSPVGCMSGPDEGRKAVDIPAGKETRRAPDSVWTLWS
jgi:hypothetical protein